MVYSFKNPIELLMTVSGMSTLWEDTDGFEKKYRHDMDIYLMIVL